jgi:hypothetical protein
MKKYFNKALVLMLSCTMILSMFIPVYGATTRDYESHWASKIIQSALDSEMAKGYPDGTFKPDNAITRGEFFSLVNNAFNYTVASQDTYTDVAVDAWYAPVIAKAKAAGYLVGYPDGGIHPEMKISRQEVAVMLNRIVKLTPVASTLTFTDGSTVADWSKQAVIAMFEGKVMKGYLDGSFKPTKEMTRAEALVVLNNILKVQENVVVDNVVPIIPPILPGDEAIVVPSGNPVDLGTAGDFVILAKTGISTVPTSAVTGNIGVSPIQATGITGFSLTMDATNQFSTSSQLTGKAFAADYTAPTPSNLTTAISNMETAYTDAAGRAVDYTELHGGDLSGKTLTAGVYKWGTGILINTDVTLSGGPNDVFIFQIGRGITQANGARIILTGGVQAKNIFWQAAESVSIGTGSHFEGIVLSMTNITVGTNATVNGRLLAQTAVTLDQSTVVQP